MIHFWNTLKMSLSVLYIVLLIWTPGLWICSLIGMFCFYSFIFISPSALIILSYFSSAWTHPLCPFWTMRSSCTSLCPPTAVSAGTATWTICSTIRAWLKICSTNPLWVDYFRTICLMSLIKWCPFTYLWEVQYGLCFLSDVWFGTKWQWEEEPRRVVFREKASKIEDAWRVRTFSFHPKIIISHHHKTF